jgi:hypothetical protein
MLFFDLDDTIGLIGAIGGGTQHMKVRHVTRRVHSSISRQRATLSVGISGNANCLVMASAFVLIFPPTRHTYIHFFFLLCTESKCGSTAVQSIACLYNQMNPSGDSKHTNSSDVSPSAPHPRTPYSESFQNLR